MYVDVDGRLDFILELIQKPMQLNNRQKLEVTMYRIYQRKLHLENLYIAHNYENKMDFDYFVLNDWCVKHLYEQADTYIYRIKKNQDGDKHFSWLG